MTNAGFTRQAGHSYTEPQKDAIYRKTGGRCTYCGKTLVKENHGKCSEKPPEGAWEIDHWLPESAGGQTVFENLWPACCECNDEKGQDDGELYLLRRGLFENKPVNREIIQRVVSAGPGRLRTGPTVPGGF